MLRLDDESTQARRNHGSHPWIEDACARGHTTLTAHDTYNRRARALEVLVDFVEALLIGATSRGKVVDQVVEVLRWPRDRPKEERCHKKDRHAVCVLPRE